MSSCLIPIISVVIAFTLFFNRGISTISLTIALVLLVVANVLVFYLYDLLSQFYTKRVDSEILNKERSYYFHQCELMNQLHEAMVSYRHDLRNHMMMLTQLLEEEKYEEAQNYLTKNMEAIPKVKVYSQTGNIYLDSILNCKLSEAEQIGTQLKYKIEASNHYVVDQRDLISILGNLLDNAIAAVKNVPDREIQFLFLENKGRIIISITNRYDGIVQVKNHKWISRKKDGEVHGYGIKNVEQTVEKYNGTVKISYDQTHFSVKVLLYCTSC